MMFRRVLCSAGVVLTLSLSAATVSAACPAAFDREVRKLHSADTVNLCEQFAGRPMLVVNTASHCGFTGQFKGLEALYQRYRTRGLVVIGVPSDDFRQEADNEAETASICYINYGVSFTMTEPQRVRDGAADPLFQYLNEQSGQPPRWNFHKYLLDRDGKVVATFGSKTEPESDAVRQAIEAAL